jgi:ABC-2 type transport system ATP-binding protein
MIIQTDNLGKRFRSNAAVNGVTLAVPEGATCALVGANGAGKTTLLRLLVNLLSPSSGAAQVLGVDSQRLTHRDFLRIGYVAESQQLPSGVSVEHFFAYARALYPSWDRALERELRKQFDLPPTPKLGELSRGMRMKVMLAAGLAFRPKLLLLDEPLSGLDPLVRDEVMSGLLAQATETTIVLSSHELVEIEACVTHVAFMSRGRLLLQESIESLSSRFREVSVILPPGAAPLRPLESWLTLRTTGGLTRFVDAAFSDETELRRKLAAQASNVLHLESQPMSLRDITKALLSANRAEASS